MKKFKKYLPTIVVVAAVLLVAGFVVKAMLSPDSANPTGSKDLTKEDIALISQGQSLGNQSSKVVLTEFGDFQCPACGQWHPFIKDTILPAYQDKIKFVFKNLPLVSIHKNAQASAQAAEAAGLQGKYWEMHNLLYETQKQWENDSDPKGRFEGFAGRLGMNVDQFKRDVDSAKIKDLIKKDLALADKLGLPGTPSFLINGTIVDTKNGFEDLKNALDKALAASSQPAQ